MRTVGLFERLNIYFPLSRWEKILCFFGIVAFGIAAAYIKIHRVLP